jgi:hypothetical protein
MKRNFRKTKQKYDNTETTERILSIQKTLRNKTMSEASEDFL